MEMKLNNIKNT